MTSLPEIRINEDIGAFRSTRNSSDKSSTSIRVKLGKQRRSDTSHQRLASISHNFINVYIYILFMCCDETV